MKIVPRCPMRTAKGAECGYPAGLGTGHPGYGACNRHGGAWPQTEDLWRQAMEIARQEDINPAEALLGLVKTAVGRSAYMDSVLTETMRKHVEDGGDPLQPPDKIRKWMSESRMERTLAARTAQMAVGAGVMQAMERRLDMEGSLVADAVASALDSLELSAEQRSAAFSVAQERLLELE